MFVNKNFISLCDHKNTLFISNIICSALYINKYTYILTTNDIIILCLKHCRIIKELALQERVANVYTFTRRRVDRVCCHHLRTISAGGGAARTLGHGGGNCLEGYYFVVMIAWYFVTQLRRTHHGGKLKQAIRFVCRKQKTHL